MTRRMIVLAALGLLAPTGCDVDTEPGRDLGATARIADTRSCASLGYAGTCADDVSIWYQDGACRVRDCGSEGKTCGTISDAVGYGCLEGPAGSTARWCDDLGYEGACLSGDVLVWTEGSSCRWAECAAYGQRCAWTDAVGFDCVQGDEAEAPTSDRLRVSEIVGNAGHSVSQRYGPTTVDANYGYCQYYGDWGGQHVHCGLDVAIEHGTPIFVPGDGTVLIAGGSGVYQDSYNPQAGELRIRLDGGTEVILGHLSAIDVRVGDRVVAGQRAGKSGSAPGAHLHLEVREVDPSIGRRTVDPLAYFGS